MNNDNISPNLDFNKHVCNHFVTFSLRTSPKKVRGRPYMTSGDVPAGGPPTFFSLFNLVKQSMLDTDNTLKGISDCVKCPSMMIIKETYMDFHKEGPGTSTYEVRGRSSRRSARVFFLSGPCSHLQPSPGHVGRSLLPIFENVDNFGKCYNPVLL